MKRNDFLKLVGKGSGTFLFGSMIKPDFNVAYDLKQIPIYDNYVKGENFYKKTISRLSLTINQQVQLQRDYENIYDRFAVKVLVNDKQIGYLAAYENIVISNLLDQGVTLTAIISELNNLDKNIYMANSIAIKVFAKLMVPATHLEITTLLQDRANNALDVYRQGYITKTNFKK